MWLFLEHFFPSSILNIWGFKQFIYVSYTHIYICDIGWQTVHRPAKCTFRGIRSCFNENLVTLCFHIQIDQLRIPSLFFSKFLTYQNLYLLFSHKVGGRLCLFYFLKIYTITCIFFIVFRVRNILRRGECFR